MLFSEKSGPFAAAHPCKAVTVDGAVFRYVLCGREGKKTLVLLNGGMNTLEMWMDYVDPLARITGSCSLTIHRSCAPTRHW